MKNIFLIGAILLFLGCSSVFFHKTEDSQNREAALHKDLNSIDELIRTHQFNNAKKIIDKYIQNNPSRMSGYEKLFFFYNVADISPDDIKKDKEKYLAYIDKNLLQDSLSMQVEYLFLITLEDSSAVSILDSLIHYYPNCSVTTDNAQEQVFDYAVMRDDSARAAGLEEFLIIYPDNKWAALAWRYLLYSYDNIEDETKLDSTLNVVDERYSNDPRMLNTVARYYLDMKQKLSEYEEKMKVMIDSINYDDWDKSFYFYGDKSREEQMATYRFTLAELLFEQEKYNKALKVLNEVPEDQLLAQHFYLMGKIEMTAKQNASAFDHLLKAVIMGDERNKWTAQADSLLYELYDDLSDGGRAFRQFVNIWAKYDAPLYTDVTEEAGLKSYKKSRIAWGDYNNDGFDDILLDGNVLLKNNTDGTFTDVSESAEISAGRTNGGLWADIDRDGNLDFFANSSSTEKNDILWKNMGDGIFKDVTDSTPLADTLQTEGAAWGDYDGDLFPDLYLANYERWQIIENEPDFLFHNEGNGKFKNVTKSKGTIPSFNENQAGRGVNWGDYDNDGFLDIFVSNYRLDKNFLWKNMRGKGFENTAEKTGVEGNYVEGWYGHTIGSEWGDFDNDGDMDLICANLAHPRYIKFSDMTQLFVNDLKKNKFYDIRETAGITYDECHSDPSWGDVNGDGYLDLFITSIYPDRRSYLYLNNGDKTFTDITYLAGVRIFNSWGAAFSDYDNDGDIDLLVCSNEGVHLFRNDTTPKNCLKVKVVDKNGTTPLIGTRIEVIQNNMKQIREIEGGKGTTNQHSMTQYFGFPDKDVVDIKVRFLDGKKMYLQNKTINQIIKIVYK